MAKTGRFKGWRSETTIAKMTPEEQKMYYDFVAEVRKCRELGKELPEPPAFSTDKKDIPSDSTPKKRGRKPGTKNPLKDKANNISTLPTSENKPEAKAPRNWWDENPTLMDVQETVIHHCSREGFCIIETNEPYWIRKIEKLRAKYPELVLPQPLFSNEDLVRVKIPYKYMKRVNIFTRNVTEEQKQTLQNYKRNEEEFIESLDEAIEEDEIVGGITLDEDITEDTTDNLDEDIITLNESEIDSEAEEEIEEEFDEDEDEDEGVDNPPATILPNAKDSITISHENEEKESEIDENEDDEEDDESEYEGESTVTIEHSSATTQSSICELSVFKVPKTRLKNYSEPSSAPIPKPFTVKDCVNFKEMVSARNILGFPKTLPDEW